ARDATARLVGHANACDGEGELGGVAPARGLEIALRLAFEEVAGAAVDVRRLAGDAKHSRAALVGLGPHRAARAAAIDDAMRFTAQRYLHPRRERRRLPQAPEPPPHPPPRPPG